MEFPYKFEPKYHTWFPIIPVTIYGMTGQPLESYGYVDSGAAFSVFRPFEAAALGLDLARGKSGAVTAGDGKVLHCAMFSLRMDVGGHCFTAPIGFSKDLRIGFNVLGLGGFFENFSEVSFHHGSRRLMLRP